MLKIHLSTFGGRAAPGFAEGELMLSPGPLAALGAYFSGKGGKGREGRGGAYF